MKTFISIFLLVVGWLFLGNFFNSPGNSNSFYNDYEDDYSNDDYDHAVDYYCSDIMSDYSSALEEANYEIERLNSDIEDAKGYAWESYEEMGEALDLLETGDTVSDPY